MAANQPTLFDTEIWKPIPGADGYEASDCGRVRGVDRIVIRRDGKPLRVKGTVLKTTVSNYGYKRCSIVIDGKSTRRGVHQVVAAAFLPAPPARIGSRRGEFNVNHIDGNKLNNRPENLEYITCSDNVHHARRTGLLNVKGEKNNKAVLSAWQVGEIRQRYANGENQVSLASDYGVNQTTISRIILRDTWKHIA